MPEDNPEKKRLIVDIKGPADEIDRINTGLVEVIGDLSLVDISVESYDETEKAPRPSWVGQRKAAYTPNLSRKYLENMVFPIAMELYTWVEHPETGEQTAVISKHNMADFSAAKQQIHDPTEPTQTRYQSFFSRLSTYQYSRSRDEENMNYVLYAKHKRPGEYWERPLGIKVNGSLELLRRLKAEDLGEYQWGETKKIKGIGPVMTKAFEKYCEELFPGVDVSLATQELDLDKLNNMLNKSVKRTRVWAWVVKQVVGSRFMASDLSEQIPELTTTASSYLDNLRALGLIDRRPSGPYSQPDYYPFEKMQDSRWDDLASLMIERGDLPSTV